MPWFAPGELRLPLKADAAEIRTQRSAVARALGELNIGLVGIRAVVLPAREYNRMVRETRNKAAVLFWATVRCSTHPAGRAREHFTRRTYLSLSLDCLSLRIATKNCLLSAPPLFPL